MATQTLALPIQNQIDALTRINLDDMLDNFGLGKLAHGRRVIERVMWGPAQMLARQVVRLDERVGAAGVQVAGRELLEQYIRRLEVVGAENIPTTGGVLFASNHPGMVDTLAFFTSTRRADVRLVSNDRPFLRALPNIAAHLIFVHDDPTKRMMVARQVTRALQNGDAVFICPAGEIEPDPAVMPGARESLARWSDSLGLFVRAAPNAVVVPTVISGVIHYGALTNPLTRVRRAQKDRARVAATIQAALHAVGYLRRTMVARIEFGAPLPARELATRGDAAAITRAIIHAVEPMIERARRTSD
ncbi:MAG: 1-acyl-sn-glycerol-3-phosphate acyltransferase [Chloroflexi bacterium]|nr:1-acyl-sn-glycerol-3-phosphate acyltransferase [Chloroflexota bacterium]